MSYGCPLLFFSFCSPRSLPEIVSHVAAMDTRKSSLFFFCVVLSALPELTCKPCFYPSSLTWLISLRGNDQLITAGGLLMRINYTGKGTDHVESVLFVLREYPEELMNLELTLHGLIGRSGTRHRQRINCGRTCSV